MTDHHSRRVLDETALIHASAESRMNQLAIVAADLDPAVDSHGNAIVYLVVATPGTDATQATKLLAGWLARTIPPGWLQSVQTVTHPRTDTLGVQMVAKPEVFRPNTDERILNLATTYIAGFTQRQTVGLTDGSRLVPLAFSLTDRDQYLHVTLPLGVLLRLRGKNTGTIRERALISLRGMLATALHATGGVSRVEVNSDGCLDITIMLPREGDVVGDLEQVISTVLGLKTYALVRDEEVRLIYAPLSSQPRAH